MRRFRVEFACSLHEKEKLYLPRRDETNENQVIWCPESFVALSREGRYPCIRAVFFVTRLGKPMWSLARLSFRMVRSTAQRRDGEASSLPIDTNANTTHHDLETDGWGGTGWRGGNGSERTALWMVGVGYRLNFVGSQPACLLVAGSALKIFL